MTKEEAKKLAKIFQEVDGGCVTCVQNICRDANNAGLGFFFWPMADSKEVEVFNYDGHLPDEAFEP